MSRLLRSFVSKLSRVRVAALGVIAGALALLSGCGLKGSASGMPPFPEPVSALHLGMDEADFFERIAQGRLPDAYSFFSGTLYPDRLRTLTDLAVPYKDGIKDTARCIPYGFTGYCRLVRSPDGIGKTVYFANDLLAVYSGAEGEDASEEHADVLYLDLRRAGDLIRCRDGLALASIEPIDNFTDAVCWMGIDRDTDDRKADAILDFIAYLTSADVQKTLASIGMLSVRSDVRDVPPEASLKNIFKEISAEYDCPIPESGCLKSWAEQGVFLLNTVLTVEDGNANSHSKCGWQIFTDKVIEIF